MNHSGDSDSTGAVTGNILGALCGYEAIEEKWKKNLELSDVILEMADDLCYGCQISEYSHYEDPDWIRKYIDMRWKDDMDREAPSPSEDGSTPLENARQKALCYYDFYQIPVVLLRFGAVFRRPATGAPAGHPCADV